MDELRHRRERRTSAVEERDRPLRAQAERYAQHARRQEARRRAGQSGVTGRVALRSWRKRDDAVLAGRMGFIKLAIRSGVPIVPISTVGGPDSMPVLATGRRIAKLLQLDRVARLKMFPIALQVPWGVSPALLPEIPLPTQFRTAFQQRTR